MPRPALLSALVLALVSGTLGAAEVGTASGTGTIDRGRANPANPGEPTIEKVGFSPHHAWAYRESLGGKTYTWLVLSDKKPPLDRWNGATDRAEARRLWCEKEGASFVAVMLKPDGTVNLTFLCPGNGQVNTEMLSTANGLDSTVVSFTARDARHLAGTLRSGRGSCPGPGETTTYCEPTGDFAFDAPLGK